MACGSRLFRRLNPTRSRRRHSKCSRRCTRNIGSGIGISLVIFLLTRNTQIVHAELAGHVTPFNDALAAVAPSHFWNMATTVGRAALNAEVTKQAMVVAYANDFKLMMIVALVALPLIFLLRRAEAQPGEAAVLE
jgi:MFS transporter, DHA2 family, multidrug resistance protein